MDSVLLVDDVERVRTITLNRPSARNALSGELISALFRALLEADRDDVGAVVLTGSDPAFCAGVDLKQAAAEGESYFERYAEEDCIGQVALTATPIIGAINGACFTGGLEIALGCDFLIASELAVFADTHARVGVLPGGGLTARLPHVVGQGNARRMSMTGQVLDAPSALDMGLVTEVVPHAGLLPRAHELARQIAEVPGTVMRPLKRVYVDSWAAAHGGALEIESRIAGENLPDYAGLEARRTAVLHRNRTQIGHPT